MFNPKLLFALAFFVGSVTADFDCPPNSIRGFPGFHTAPCYLYERFETQFVTAERMCRMSGGHLASISDGFVNAFVAHGGNEAFLIMEAQDFWIGGENLEDQSVWQWVDGENWGGYTKWDINEPSNDTKARCTAMKLIDGKWQAQDCFDRKPYVCELNYVNSTNPTVAPSTPKWLTTTPQDVETEPWSTTLKQLETSSTPKIQPTSTPTVSTTLEQTSTEEPSTLTSTAQPSTADDITSTLEPSTSTQRLTTTVKDTTITSTLEPTSTEEPSTLTSTVQPSTVDDSTSTLEPSTSTQKLTTTVKDTTITSTLEPTSTSTEQPSTSTLAPTSTSTEQPSTSTTLEQTTTVKPTTTTESTTLETTTQEMMLVCPGEDSTYAGLDDGGNDQCYTVYNSRGWTKDLEFCNSIGGDLISIHRKPEFMSFLIDGTEETPGHVDITIGLREDIVEGEKKWVWTDGTPYAYKNWLAGYPKPDKDNDPLRCAVYFTNTKTYDKNYGKWKTVDCNSIQGRFVCEQDPIEVPAFMAMSIPDHRKPKQFRRKPRRQ